MKSRADLKRKIGHDFPGFCFPNGSYNEHVIQVLKEGGFKLAFTTKDGHNDLRTTDPLRLMRTNITPRTSLPVFWIRLTVLGAYIDSWRHKS